MQNTRLLSTCLKIHRYISSSSVNSTSSREGRFMTKIMQRGSKSKKKYYNTNIDSHNTIKASNLHRLPSNRTTRRMSVRNKLFMEHITDQISMGKASAIINGAIEITHVEITQNSKFVNVFWNQATNTPISQEALQKCALIIRHELSQLRIIGVVPVIQFVENVQRLLQNEVEKRLTMIESDFKDFEILSYSEQMELAASHTDQASHKEPMDNDSEPDKPQIELPVMRQDVLGLDHSKIMTQIVASVSKSRIAKDRRMSDMNTTVDNSSDDVVSKQVAEFLTRNEQKDLFKDFLKKRRIEEKRKYRMKQSHNRQLDYPEEEMGRENDNNDVDFEDKYYEDDVEYKR